MTYPVVRHAREVRKTLAIGNRGIDLAIGVMLLLVVGSSILPTAMSDWFNTSTTGWGSGTAALWPLVPLLGVMALVYLLYRESK